MDEVRILEIKQSVFKNNDEQADKLRRELKRRAYSYSTSCPRPEQARQRPSRQLSPR